MISKLVGYGATRAEALSKAAHALDAYVIRGLQHNAPLLRSVLDAPDFVAGDFSTAFLAEHFPTPEASAPMNLPLTVEREQEVLALAAALHVWRGVCTANEKIALGAGDGGGGNGRCLVLTVGAEGVQTPVTVRRASSAIAGTTTTTQTTTTTIPLEIEFSDRIIQLALMNNTSTSGSPLIHTLLDGTNTLCQIINREPRHLTLQYCGAHRRITIDSSAAAAVAHWMPPPHKEDLSKIVRSPMPGVLVSVAVSKGDEVEEGDAVAVVEAMKMRNVLRAGSAGRVAAVKSEVGASVAADEVIVSLE